MKDVDTFINKELFAGEIPRLTKSEESLVNDIFKKLNIDSTISETKNTKQTNSLEDEINSLLFIKEENSFSSEVFFGVDNPFKNELVNYCKLLIDEVRRLVADKSGDKLVLATSGKEKQSPLITIIENMGGCISRYCNIEKCYIGLTYAEDAYTMPVAFDSSILIDDMKKAVKSYNDGSLYIDTKHIRSDEDIEKQLLKLEDIVLIKDGYAFKNKDGKVFIITLGVSFIINKAMDMTPEMLCAIVFHEIGHNFEQILRSTNQMLIDIYIKSHLYGLKRNKLFSIFDFLIELVNESFVSKLIYQSKDKKFKISLIKSILIGGVYVDKDGKVISRKDIGETELSYIEEAIRLARKMNKLKSLSLFSKILSYIGYVWERLFIGQLRIFSSIYNSIKRDGYNKKYGDIITKNKSYEQFADSFVAAYGLASHFTSFIKNYELSNVKRQNEYGGKCPEFLNHIPILSKIILLDELKNEKFNYALKGYDTFYERIADQYVALDHELKNNKNLSTKDKQDIISQMELIKQDFELYKEIEMSGVTKSKSLAKWLIDKVRSGDISEVGKSTGMVEYVLKTIDAFEAKNSTKPADKDEEKKIEELAKVVNNTIENESK